MLTYHNGRRRPGGALLALGGTTNSWVDGEGKNERVKKTIKFLVIVTACVKDEAETITLCIHTWNYDIIGGGTLEQTKEELELCGRQRFKDIWVCVYGCMCVYVCITTSNPKNPSFGTKFFGLEPQRKPSWPSRQPRRSGTCLKWTRHLLRKIGKLEMHGWTRVDMRMWRSILMWDNIAVAYKVGCTY